ncbi:MAG: sulfate ABC transporter substrate-binding protein [Methylacidiphilales bacterium]|nr:sulfate ABC transporter substrate-binding protein [Candidatus Methylacidiphilales bacterium]
MKTILTLILTSFLLGWSVIVAPAKDTSLLNVSYDPTRELYEDYNTVFADYWKKQTGDNVTVSQSHGGSGKQARAVIDGLAADVVTLALPPDIDAIVNNAHIIGPKWEQRLPDHSSPYTSTIVFLVRKGNPKAVKDWPDLIKPGIEVVTPNPKTSGGARWNFLGAYGYALKTDNNDQAKAKDFVKALYANVKVLDTGARGSTVTFVERGQGDVLIAWENEALLSVNKTNPGQFEIVYPSQTILAEPPVAVVDANVDKHGTRAVAEAYLKYLYSPVGQDVIARNYYRPRDKAVLAKYTSQFPAIPLFTVGELFGGWGSIQKEFFGDGGVFDQIYKSPAAAAN